MVATQYALNTKGAGVILSQEKRDLSYFHQFCFQAISYKITFMTVTKSATDIYLRITDRSKKNKDMNGKIKTAQKVI
ncbi:hypothetical protein GCM10008934_42130 [Virgibacillus salarius]